MILKGGNWRNRNKPGREKLTARTLSQRNAREENGPGSDDGDRGTSRKRDIPVLDTRRI